jgi:DNA-directed RNA polymerase subunit M/transcription elongation factor TFIIS
METIIHDLPTLKIAGVTKTDLTNIGKVLMQNPNTPLDQVYDAIGSLSCCGKGAKVKSTVIEELKNGIQGWATLAFAENRESRKKKDQMLERPPEIRDGDQECVKCKQRKVIVVEMQTRSADEGFTYQVVCYNAECKFIQTLT